MKFVGKWNGIGKIYTEVTQALIYTYERQSQETRKGTSGEGMPPGRGLAGGVKLERENTGGGKIGARINWRGLEGREGRTNPRKIIMKKSYGHLLLCKPMRNTFANDLEERYTT